MSKIFDYICTTFGACVVEQCGNPDYLIGKYNKRLLLFGRPYESRKFKRNKTEE